MGGVRSRSRRSSWTWIDGTGDLNEESVIDSDESDSDFLELDVAGDLASVRDRQYQRGYIIQRSRVVPQCQGGYDYFSTTFQCYKVTTLRRCRVCTCRTPPCPTCPPCNSSIIWSDARSKCQSEGGDLASVHDEDTNEFLKSHLRMYNSFLGGTGTWVGRIWRWSDGSDFNYTNWNDNTTGTTGRGETRHMYMKYVRRSNSTGTWDYVSGAFGEPELRSYICQRNPGSCNLKKTLMINKFRWLCCSEVHQDL